MTVRLGNSPTENDNSSVIVVVGIVVGIVFVIALACGIVLYKRRPKPEPKQVPVKNAWPDRQVVPHSPSRVQLEADFASFARDKAAAEANRGPMGLMG